MSLRLKQGLFILLILGLALFLVTIPNLKSVTEASVMDSVLRCNQNIERSEECQLKLLEEYAKNDGIAKATHIIAQMERQGKINYNCHELGHTLGIWYQGIDPEGALKGDLKICGSGYLHGLLIANVDNKNTDDSLQNMATICKSGNLSIDECAHGVGHALNVRKISLSQSVRYCEKLAEIINSNVSDDLKDGIIQSGSTTEITQCESGWLMEVSRNIFTPLNQDFIDSVCLGISTKTINDAFYIDVCNVFYSNQLMERGLNYSVENNNKRLTLYSELCESLSIGDANDRVTVIVERKLFVESLCWTFLGSALNSPYLANNEPANAHVVSKLLVTYCKSGALLKTCINSYISNHVKRFGEHKDYDKVFCNDFNKEVKLACEDQFLREEKLLKSGTA